jgi:GntR family transcriptional regulator
MVRTMSSRPVRHREIREALAERITRGELRPGDRLPAERQLQEDFDCARSVVRQALAALTRDGWIMSTYPRGYVVLGARIPWISRLRLLSDEPWKVEIVSATEGMPPANVADALAVSPDTRVAIRRSRLGPAGSGDPWGLGASYYPTEGLEVESIDALLALDEITYDDLETTFGRRIVGYWERIAARRPSTEEARVLSVAADTPVLEVRRVSRTTTTAISAFTFVGRSDRFEADYLIQA